MTQQPARGEPVLVAGWASKEEEKKQSTVFGGKRSMAELAARGYSEQLGR